MFFSDVTDTTLGAEARYRRAGTHYGGTVADLNSDGRPDVVYHRIFWNNGDGTFRVSELPGAPESDNLATVTAGDFDGDGWVDLLSNGRLYRNDGDGGFTLLPGYVPAALPGSGWGDYDLDGDLDLLLAGGYQGGQAVLENTPAGFVDRWEQLRASVYTTQSTPWVPYTPRVIDLDQDGLPDMLWVNDHGQTEFWRQTALGVFENATEALHFAVSDTEMGCDIDDVDNDGDWDVLIQDAAGGVLYLNENEAGFDEAGFEAHIRRYGWGWGVSLLDFDNDGLLDFVGVGQMIAIFAQPDSGVRAWRQIPGGAFTPEFEYITPTAGVRYRADAYGVSEFDMDNDGDLDVLVHGRWMFRNELDQPNTHWLRVNLDRAAEPSIPPGAFGTIVRARIGDRWIMRRVDGGSNYRSQSETTIHFGLGADTRVDELRVEWTNGDVTTLDNVAADQTLLIQARELDCAADISGNGRVDLADIALLLQAFGATPNDASFDERADLARDQRIDLRDLAEMLARWDATCDPPPARPQALAIMTPTDAVAGQPSVIAWSDNRQRAHQVESITSWNEAANDFEDPNQNPFETAGGWTVTDEDAHSGARSLRSGAGSQSQTTLTIDGPAVVEFAARVDGTPEDRLEIRIDGVLIDSLSVGAGWTELRIPVDGGRYTLAWTFVDADTSQSAGLNGAFMDELRIRAAVWTPVVGMTPLTAPSNAVTADFEDGAVPHAVSFDSHAWRVVTDEAANQLLRSPLLSQHERAQISLRAPLPGALHFRYRTIGANPLITLAVEALTDLPKSPDWTDVDIPVPPGAAYAFLRIFNPADTPAQLEVDDITYIPDAQSGDSELAFPAEFETAPWTPATAMPDCQLRVRARRPEGTWGPWNFSAPFEIGE
ncbi:MAG: VCBS repeat-containing protein [Phycisphaerales bacterium]|nr:VCBS repeat-containing protein [Phycisphaerales bacterium]